MYVNMQMLGHNYTRGHNEIAVCTCRKNRCKYNTYKSRLQQMCCMGDSNTTKQHCCQKCDFPKWGKTLVEL